MGKAIAASDHGLNQLKARYSNSNQLFIRVDENIYYGFIDSISSSNAIYTIVFDSIKKFDFDATESNAISLKENDVTRNVSLFYIELEISKEQYESKFKDMLQLYEWYAIRIGSDELTDSHAKIYKTDSYDFEEVPTPYQVKTISKLEPKKKNILKKAYTLSSFTESSEKEIQAILNNLPSNKVEFISIYDVGQGNCNALCDSDARPLLYFDFGGGILKNQKTYPKHISFCFEQNPTFILSHWDKDHWCSYFKFSESLNFPWIVPSQSIGPQGMNLARKLNSKGNLYIWPTNVQLISSHIGVLFRCSDGNSIHRHDTGLGFIAQIINHKSNEIKKYLVPGDARYNSIPCKSSIKDINGLIASHHGGMYYNENIIYNTPTTDMIPCNHYEGKIIYSFGKENSHGHPSHEEDHFSRGWKNKVDTATPTRGHCGIGITSTKRHICSSGTCTLDIEKF